MERQSTSRAGRFAVLAEKYTFPESFVVGPDFASSLRLAKVLLL
jgi:hypothetical protein